MRNMKYHVWITISLTLILFVSGCDTYPQSSTKNEPAKSTTEKPTIIATNKPVITAEPTPKKIGESKAIEISENYAYNNTDILTRTVKSVSSVKHLKISSAQKEKKELGYYYIELKGNFYGMDEYGMVEGRYAFEWTIRVNEESGEALQYFPYVYKTH